MSQLNLSQNMQDLIVSRFQQVKDLLSPDLAEQVDKLSDEEKIKQTDSRYAQFLSDRTNHLQSLMKKFEDFTKEVEDKEERAKLDSANKSLRDFILRLSSPSVDSDKS
jgi:DNA anti-recombination protein RmuC